MIFGRGWWALGLACVTVVSFAQGGGGFGGGGLGGAPQGGIQGPDGGQVNRQLFLTPGDRTEWEYEAKENEAIRVSITSQVFDPAVSIVDEQGKKLAENDDIAPGNQMARVVFVAPKAGKYKAVVTNYKGTAGGAFSFESNRWMTFPLPVSVPTDVKPEPTNVWARVKIEKPGDYAIAARSESTSGLSHLGPGGDELNPVFYDQFGGYLRARFRADVPGDYFFFVSRGTHYHLLPVERRVGKVGATLSETLAVDQVHDVEVEAQKDEIVEIALNGKGSLPSFELDLYNSTRTEPAPYALVQSAAFPVRYTLRMLRDGAITVRVRKEGGVKTNYELGFRTVGRPLPKGAAVDSKLDWNGSDVWTFEGRPGDVVNLRVTSDVYVPYLTVMSPEGKLLRGWSMESPPVVVLPVEVKTPGRYVVCISGGGIGPYRFQSQTVEPRALNPGVSQGEIKRGPEIWRLRAEKGQDLALRMSSSNLRWFVKVVGPDGETVGEILNGSDFLRLKIAKSGEYTVTVTNSDGTTGKYEIKRIDLDR